MALGLLLTAQAMALPAIEFGGLAGFNAAYMPWRQVDGLDHDHQRICFNGGVYLYHPFNRDWGVRAELLYMEKGTMATGFFSLPDTVLGLTLDHTYSTDLALAYVEIPVTLQAWLGPGERRPVSLFFGAYVNRLLSARMEYWHTVKPDVGYADETGSLGRSAFNASAFGLIIGGTVTIERFEVVARYDRDMSPATDRTFTGINALLTPKSRVLSFSLGYLFP